jgi:hypothetical protein
MSYDSWSETSESHSLEIDEFWIDEEGFNYSLSVVHPPECFPEIEGEGENRWLMTNWKCWIGHEVNNAGMEPILNSFEYPNDDGIDWLVIASVLTGKSIPIRYKASGGYDYWGEYDEDYEIELIK